MDRQQAMERQRQFELSNLLREIMEVIEPGEKIKWGAKKHVDLVAYVACHLAIEYKVLTGHGIVDLMTEQEQQKVETILNATPPPQADDALPLT